MKKLLILLAAAITLLGAGTTAYAAAEASVDCDAFTAKISAGCPGAGYALVLITNRESGACIWAGQETVKDGTVSVRAALNRSITTGWYDVTVTDNIKGVGEASFFFATQQYRSELLARINELKNNAETVTAELLRILSDDAPLFKYNAEMFEKITDKSELCSRIAAGTYTSLDDFSAGVDAAVEEMYLLQERDTAIDKFNSASASEMTAVLERYYDLFNITLDSIYRENSSIINGVLADLTISDINQVAPVFRAIAAVCAVNSAERAELMNVFFRYDQYLGLYNRLSSLSPDELSAVLKIVEQKTYTKAEDIARDISDVLANMPAETAPSYETGRGSVITVSDELLDRNQRPPIIQDISGEGLVFYDLDAAPWSKESVLKLYESGVIKGRTETEFAPGEPITRAEFIQLAVKAFGKENSAGAEEFADVKQDRWYYSSVMAARGANIIEGYEDNCFYPEQNLSKQEAAAIICRALGMAEAADTELFADDGSIAEYARGAVYALKKAGIVSGTPEGRFEPESYATRAQCAVMICAALGEVQ